MRKQSTKKFLVAIIPLFMANIFFIIQFFSVKEEKKYIVVVFTALSLLYILILHLTSKISYYFITPLIWSLAWSIVICYMGGIYFEGPYDKSLLNILAVAIFQLIGIFTYIVLWISFLIYYTVKSKK